MQQKKVLFIDMDGVLADFDSAITEWFELHPNLKQKYIANVDHIPGIFRDLKPIKDSMEAIQKLHQSDKYDMFIATTAPWGNPASATDKRYWIEKHFGDLFHKKMLITHRKDMLKGDILIDDREKNGAKDFDGEFIHFGWNYMEQKWNPYPHWNSVLEKLL